MFGVCFIKKVKCLIVTVLLICQCEPLLSQENNHYEVIDEARLLVTYNFVWRNDTTTPKLGKAEDMVLLIGNKISCFQSMGNYRFMEYRLSHPDVYSGSEYEQIIHETLTNFGFRIYKNFPSGLITVMERVMFTGTFEYVEDIPDFHWEILDDTLTIEGYLCQKAVCDYSGRTWEAWFTDELPFSDGPYKFCGLPGLILNMSDMKLDCRFRFKSIEVPAQGTTVKWEYKETFKTTKQGLFKVIDQAAESTLRNFDERTSSGMQKAVYEYMRSMNNPIELDRK